MKNLLIILMTVLILTSCAESQTFIIDGEETIVIPVWLSGWELYEPVRLKTPKEMGVEKFNDIFE